MWITLYVAPAVVLAAAAWLMSQRVQSCEPVSDVARGFWAIVAGALWPVVLLGVAQLLAVRFVARRMARARADHLVFLPSVLVQDVVVRS
jgi:hypothetical protein